MKADYHTYRTATTMAIWGLVVQFAVAVALAVFGVLYSDHAVLTTSFAVGAGVLVWLVLVIVFDQHRRERIEAMEAEALAQTGGESASVFRTQDELRPAARRLAGLHKYFVPGMSLVVGGAIFGLGLWRLLAYRDLSARTDFAPAVSKAPVMGWVIGLLIAVFGFIIARFAAGMGKQTAWNNLKAGASHAAGMSLMGLVLGVAFMVSYVGPDGLYFAMPYVAAIFSIIIGVEILLNFLLGMYRPRRAGEIPAAAFNSRLLGFVAAPDTVAKSISEAINYQLGFDITGNWFYQLVNKALVPLVIVGLLIVWFLSGLTVVQPHQRAVVLRFGKPVGQELGPGLHFKWPWPIDSVYVPELYRKDKDRLTLLDRTVTGLRRLELGTTYAGGDEPILWTNDHPGTETYQYVRANPNATGVGGSDLVDLAIVSAELPLQYIVTDVKKFDMMGPPELRDDLLRTIGQRTVTRYFQRTYLDQVLGYGRTQISADLREELQKAFDELSPPGATERGAGVRVVSIGISGVHPPKDTAASFESRVMADSRRIANLQAAQADSIATLTQAVGNVALANEIVAAIDQLSAIKTQNAAPAAIAEQEAKIASLIGKADGNAASLLADAKARRWQTHNAAAGRAARYEGQLATFNAAPSVFVARAYFSALTDLFEDSRIIIAGRGMGDTRFTIDLNDKDLGTELFAPQQDQ
jgi:regulator of protease activity HflC (stomatin/prohibitin superfamily)